MPPDSGKTLQAVAKRICQEQCAFMGEPACWEIHGQWPNPGCDDPGCQTLAAVAIDAIERVSDG